MIEIQRVGPERLADLEQLFSTRATLRGCQCMIFRLGPDGTVTEPDGKVRQQAMAELVRSGVPVGLIGYAEGEPVAWCSVAPRETFRGLDVVGEPSDPVWSITCFWLHPDVRRQGVMTDLLEAIAEMPDDDRAIAERIHAIVSRVAPHLLPRTWYGMPAHADGKDVVCFFQAAAKFDARYATLGFNDTARLDGGDMWPVTFAIVNGTGAVEERVEGLVRTAVG